MKQTLTKQIAILVSVLGLVSAGGIAAAADAVAAKAGVTQKPYGKLADGTEVSLFKLVNSKGAEAEITNYGGIVVSLKMPDRDGKMGDVLLGYDKLDDYVKETPYFGCLVGRYGNRIGKGKFTLGGTTYTLAQNDHGNHLHGGAKGFDKVVWSATPLDNQMGPAVELKYVSKDGEEGYPGTLSVTAVYTLTSKNELRLDFTATTDKPTVCNLTQHNYFNLACAGDILKHEMMIKADRFTPVDSGLITTGEMRPVAGTPFDFRKPTAIGARVNAADEQLKFGGGYDHNWVINKKAGKLELMARVVEPTSGRILEVLSTEPGLQFYCGNFLDGHLIGKGGKAYAHRTGFCLEPQHYPDSPNRPEFPSVVLKPGETYKHTMIYRFSAK
jgi:aldose 1-epimerase